VKLKVRLFASLREKVAGDPRVHRGREELALEAGASVQDVLEHYGISRRMSQMLLVNGQQVSRDPDERRQTLLSEGDVVSVFPPLAGG
jgi:molybdopterin converting factor small subunit